MGQLDKLDSLLQIKELNIIQWVPGANAPKERDWLEVYEKILNTGKKSTDIWLMG